MAGNLDIIEESDLAAKTSGDADWPVVLDERLRAEIEERGFSRFLQRNAALLVSCDDVGAGDGAELPLGSAEQVHAKTGVRAIARSIVRNSRVAESSEAGLRCPHAGSPIVTNVNRLAAPRVQLKIGIAKKIDAALIVVVKRCGRHDRGLGCTVQAQTYPGVPAARAIVNDQRLRLRNIDPITASAGPS